MRTLTGKDLCLCGCDLADVAYRHKIGVAQEDELVEEAKKCASLLIALGQQHMRCGREINLPPLQVEPNMAPPTTSGTAPYVFGGTSPTVVLP